jgi:MoxR-like ATPase
VENYLEDRRREALALESHVAKVVIGQDGLIRLINTALHARGHVLLEGDVGVGKTTVLRAFARALGGAFERIEGTVDLMPGDLLYHTDVDPQGRPRIQPGPLVRHGDQLVTFFFNEINRARPQVQSLLLRAMAERSVSAFNQEVRFPQLNVFADRNKVEKEETFELASAARDRFMFELSMNTPQGRDERRALVLDARFHDTETLIAGVPSDVVDWRELDRVAAQVQAAVHTSTTIEDYVLELWAASADPARYGIAIEGVHMDRLVLAGASPRGMSALMRAARTTAWLRGRLHVEPDDVRAVVPSALAHRIFLTPVYELRRGEIAPALVQGLMDRIAAP